MADIDQIIAGGAGSSSRADFSGIPKIADAYWKGKEDVYKQEGRDLFKGGVPKNADGTINYSAMRDALFQRGDVGQGTALDNLDVQRQSLKLGQAAAANMGRLEGGSYSDTGSAPAPIVSPPSANRTASTPVAAPLNRGGEVKGGSPDGEAPSGAPNGGQGTIMQVLAAQGIPNEQLGAASASIARQLGLENPNAPINLQDPQIRNVLVPAVQQLKRAGVGQVVSADPPQGGPMPVAGPAPQPQQAPQVQPAPAFAERFAPANTRGLAPTENDPNIQQRAAQYTAIIANPALPESVRKAATMRLEALQKNSEMTTLQKEYAQAQRQGYKGSLEDYQNRTDDNTAKRDILTKYVIPKLEESQKTASAARDEIQAIHRSREQLDAPGGIFNGAGADVRLKLAKVADFLGVPNTDKIVNTEAFGAAIGARVLSLVKGLGAGAGISNADRDFAAGMAGGSIKLDEKSIRKILDIGEGAARAKITMHNDSATKMIKSNDALKDYTDVMRVDAPGAYKKPEAAAPSSFTKGQIAVNPKTKQQLQFDGKAWVPFS